jgi:hypothetical protein
MYPAEQVVTKPSSWEVAMLKLRMQFTKSRPVVERSFLKGLAMYWNCDGFSSYSGNHDTSFN